MSTEQEIKSEIFGPIFYESNLKMLKLEKELKKTREMTSRKLMVAAAAAVLRNPEYRRYFNITPVNYAINLLGYHFIAEMPTISWSIYIQNCPYYIGHPKFEESVSFPDLLREYALWVDPTALKYIKNPTIQHLSIIARAAPELLGTVAEVPQEIQDLLIKIDPVLVRYLPNPTVKTAIAAIRCEPCNIFFLPAATQNINEVLSTFVTQHYITYRNVKALRAIQTTEHLVIPEKVFKTLTRLNRRT